jgi:enoyl-CoA hydratase
MGAIAYVGGVATLDTGTDTLLVDIDEGIALVTFNRPEKHNAMSQAMRTALAPTLAALEEDPGVRVIVLTGAGERAFVSGADISEFGDLRTSPEARAEYDRVAAETTAAWQAVEKPIVAMIRGFCIGGGLMTAMQADIRIAAEDSQFAIPAARLGLGYAFTGVEALVDLVGRGWAAEILFSGRRLNASEALRIGLVNHVVPVEDLRSTTMTLAATISQNAPLTVTACKVAIGQIRIAPDLRDTQRLAGLIEACFRSDDYREGQAAFVEKRRPRFRGH